MKPAPFRLEQPDTVDSLCRLLAEHGDSARILAGGQSLVPMMNFRLVKPEILIDINRVAGLNYIRRQGDMVAIGAMTRHVTVKESSVVATDVPLITAAYEHIAHGTIRNRGTIGGNFSHADPSSELPAIAVCLGAQFIVTSSDGTRTVSAADFFQGMLETDLRPGEFLAEVRFPVATGSHRFGFQEFSPRHGDFAVALVAVAVELEDDICVSASIVHGAVRDKPGHVVEAETAVCGGPLSGEAISRAAQATAVVEPTLQNYHGDAAFKSDLLRTLTGRALSQAGGH